MVVETSLAVYDRAARRVRHHNGNAAIAGSAPDRGVMDGIENVLGIAVGVVIYSLAQLLTQALRSPDRAAASAEHSADAEGTTD